MGIGDGLVSRHCRHSVNQCVHSIVFVIIIIYLLLLIIITIIIISVNKCVHLGPDTAESFVITPRCLLHRVPAEYQQSTSRVRQSSTL